MHSEIIGNVLGGRRLEPLCFMGLFVLRTASMVESMVVHTCQQPVPHGPFSKRGYVVFLWASAPHDTRTLCVL